MYPGLKQIVGQWPPPRIAESGILKISQICLSSDDCNFASYKYFGVFLDLERSRLDLSKKSNWSKKYSKLEKLQVPEFSKISEISDPESEGGGAML